MKNLLLVVVAAVFVGYSYFSNHPGSTSYVVPPAIIEKNDRANAILAQAFAHHQSHLQVSGYGTVSRLLPDDNSGGRHQKFLVRLSPDHTVLIAHNIDLAPRINALHAGGDIQFSGEYVWNEKGGVIHWTHRDPQGLHEAGWLLYQGKKYQ